MQSTRVWLLLAAACALAVAGCGQGDEPATIGKQGGTEAATPVDPAAAGSNATTLPQTGTDGQPSTQESSEAQQGSAQSTPQTDAERQPENAMREGTTLPEGFPDAVKLPPGTAIVASSSGKAQAGGKEFMVTVTLSQTMDQVFAYYDGALKGYSKTAHPQQKAATYAGSDLVVTVSAAGDRMAVITVIQPESQGGRTSETAPPGHSR